MKKIAQNTLFLLLSSLGVMELYSFPVYRLDDRFYESLVPEYKQLNEANRALFRIKKPEDLTHQYSKIERITKKLIHQINNKLDDPSHPESEKKLLQRLRKRVKALLRTAKERMNRKHVLQQNR